MNTSVQVSVATLEHTMHALAQERRSDQVTALCAAAGAALDTLRRQHPAEWRRLVPEIRAMRGFATLQEDPFTRHGYMRPRGYPGDADLLDFIYRSETVAAHRLSAAGLGVFRAMCGAAAPTAVRNRRAMVARLVDAAALDVGRPLRIASIGCGHLAEAEKMASLDASAIERFWAIDQDPRTIAEVRRRFPDSAIATACASVKEFLHGTPHDARELDFFFASGLFDYLHDRAARCLVRTMVDRLRPGGTLLIANFVPGTPDRGYMEAIMDWWLVYRTQSEMAALDAGVAQSRIADKRTFTEPSGNIAFLELRRR